MSASVEDLLTSLARRSAHVTQQLQSLLDAQSDGLLKGLGREPTTTASSTPTPATEHINGLSQPVSPNVRHTVYRDDPLGSPSLTPARYDLSGSMAASSYTRAEPRRRKVVPVRQPPPPKPPSLREARVGIAENLRSLAAIKSEEARVYSSRAQKGEAGLARIAALMEQRDGLTRDMQKLEDKSKNDEEDAELERQELEFDGEIRALEERLSELRAQLREVRRERSEKENNRAAEISSYKNALAELARTVSRDVLGSRSEFRRARPLGKNNETGVWSLPEDRRTLELVKEDVEIQMQEAEESQARALKEGVVCEEGAELWESVVSRMVSLEKHLSREIRLVNGTRPESRLSDATTPNEHSTATTPGTDGGPSQQGFAQGMQGVLVRMDDTIDSLTSDLAKAEEQRWSLLICCIGAEVEALKEAQELLGDTLVQSQMLSSVSKGQLRGGKQPSGPRSEGSGLTASMHTAEGSAGEHTPAVGSHDEGRHDGDDRDDRDVEDPQALFGAHDACNEGSDHEHELQDPELLISHD